MTAYFMATKSPAAQTRLNLRKAMNAQRIQLPHGSVTQNGNYISLKTDSYSQRLSFYLEVAKELQDYLKTIGIHVCTEEAYVCKADNSTSRLNCVSVWYPYSGDMSAIPFNDSCKN
jgi:hypothetical protein